MNISKINNTGVSKIVIKNLLTLYALYLFALLLVGLIAYIPATRIVLLGWGDVSWNLYKYSPLFLFTIIPTFLASVFALYNSINIRRMTKNSLRLYLLNIPICYSAAILYLFAAKNFTINFGLDFFTYPVALTADLFNNIDGMLVIVVVTLIGIARKKFNSPSQKFSKIGRIILCTYSFIIGSIVILYVMNAWTGWF